ncbi:hypothetical protein AAE478_004191 [Parahypoxylon ruwenzoriense]
MLITDYRLFRARRRVSGTTYRIFNKLTGCYGAAVRDTPESRSAVTIYHGTRCCCLDVRMSVIAEHAQNRYRRRRIKATRRDDLVMAIKLRLPNMGIRYKVAVDNDPASPNAASPKEANDRPLKVIDMRKGQMLVEEWTSAEAWRKRTIWKDW